MYQNKGLKRNYNTKHPLSTEDQHSSNSDKPAKRPDRKKGGEEFPLQEYRLVPVEEWDERRLFIAKVTGAFVVLGLLIALISPVEYQTEATLMPEVQVEKSSPKRMLVLIISMLPGGMLAMGILLAKQVMPGNKKQKT